MTTLFIVCISNTNNKINFSLLVFENNIFFLLNVLLNTIMMTNFNNPMEFYNYK